MGNRSVWKGPYVQEKLIFKVNKVLKSGKMTVIKTWSRNSTIVPSFTGLTFAVHNGRKFISVLVDERMIGKKLGEFSPTRTFKGHSNNKK